MCNGLVDLSQSELFSRIGEDSLEKIQQRFKRVTFEADDLLCRENEIGDKMFIIVDGEVTILKNTAWGQRELNRRYSGEVVGEMSLISHGPRSATVKAVTRTECMCLDQTDFDQVMSTDIHIAYRLAEILSQRLTALGEKSSSEIIDAYQALMFGLADLADSRDPETGEHLERTRSYCALLAEILSKTKLYKSKIDSVFIECIFQVSPLHDIGKVAIPDRILLKPGRLSQEEFEVMKLHAAAGAKALTKVLEQCDRQIFHMAHNICLHHHEKWDGTGYPDGLAGEDIPLEARIMAIADVYDALLSKRVYKEPMSYQEAAAIIRDSSNIAFDPVMTEIMLDSIHRFEEIHRERS